MELQNFISSDLNHDLHANARKRRMLLRHVRSAPPTTRTELAKRLEIDKSTVTDHIKPLIALGLIREQTRSDGVRNTRVLSFNDGPEIFVGVNLGVRHSQVGFANLTGQIQHQEEFETPSDPNAALNLVNGLISGIRQANPGKPLSVIGVSVPGMTDPGRSELLYAPNLGWRNVKIASELDADAGSRVVVENDSTAAALYEASLLIHRNESARRSDLIVVRSGTGIGVGLVIGGEVFRGGGSGTGIAGEFGHMTIVAGGKPCVCGNRGCWEKYASAASAASLYLGDRPPGRGESVPRFVEIVSKAENGDNRSRRTLEKIGDYLGIGIANVIMGVGIPRVIISGRLVYGWRYLKEPMYNAIRRSVIGRIDGWSVEAGEPAGSALGGALEVAVDEFITRI